MVSNEHTNALSETSRAASHDLTLAYELSVELTAIECQVNIEVDAVKGALRGVHPLEILLQVLPGEVRGKCDDFLDACEGVLVLVVHRSKIR